VNKVLIVDDDNVRLGKLKQALVNNFDLVEEQIDSAFTVSDARGLLKRITYNIVFLDMALPHFNDSHKVDDWGGRILNDIKRARVEPPEKIFGYTALKEGVDKKEKEFDDIGFSLDYSTASDLSWVNKRKEAINYSLSRSKHRIKLENDYAILTVHGIRTFGSWQERLERKINESYPDKNIEHLTFKFTGIDFFTFLIPPLRKKIVEKLAEDIKVWLKENKACEVYCFSHSFGTYLTIKALEGLENESGIESIKYLVLSGSVLNNEYDFNSLKHLKNTRIINDCAVSDMPLLFSEAFVLDTGMAGRTGFRGLSNANITNRFFPGGHSVFFDAESRFISKYWLPLLKDEIIKHDKDSTIGPIQEFLSLLSRVSSKIKKTYPVIIMILFFLFFGPEITTY